MSETTSLVSSPRHLSSYPPSLTRRSFCREEIGAGIRRFLELIRQATIAFFIVATATSYSSRIRKDSVAIVRLYAGHEIILATFIVLLIPSVLYPFLVAVCNR